MAYKAILVDMFNLTYRHYKKQMSFTLLANNVVTYIEKELISRLEKDGTLYLLFDPIPKSDLGISKNFTYHPFRQNISSDYKANRQFNKEVLEAVKLLKKYFTYKGENIKTCIANHLEADDFVEGLINLIPNGKIMMVTNDGDWARYLSDRVTMINKDINHPYTADDYYKENGVEPNITNITLKKALYGDRSDNIRGVKLDKKINYYTDTKETLDTLLLEIAKENKQLNEIEDILKKCNFNELVKKENKSPCEELAYTLMTLDSMYVGTNSFSDYWETFLTNIRLIKCRGKDIEKYISWKPLNEKYNRLMDVTLGRIKNKSTNHKFVFGNVKQG